MIAKEHKTQDGRIILAVCDSDIAGKRFEENGLQLDLSSSFYKGEEASEEQLNALAKRAHIINLAGKNAVEFGIKQGIISKAHILKIKGVPHAQALI